MGGGHKEEGFIPGQPPLHGELEPSEGGVISCLNGRHSQISVGSFLWNKVLFKLESFGAVCIVSCVRNIS